jgi:predicted ATPase
VAELALHGQCKQIALGPLGLEAIETISRRGWEITTARATLLVERTGGNPLFVVSIVNKLAQSDISGRTPDAILWIPHDVRRFIDRQIDQPNESDRSLLTAASVIGREFATAAVAAALEIDVEMVETVARTCHGMACSPLGPNRSLGRMVRPQSSIRSAMISTVSCCTTACRRRGGP